MNKNNIMKNTANKLGRLTIKLKKHSPEILIIGGVIGTVVSTALACKATLKLNDILEDSKNTVDKIHECSDNPDMADKYTKEDARKDLIITYAQTGVKLVRLYSPALAVGILSISSILASNHILRKRTLALAAAYTAVDKTFKEYRSRVVSRFGEQVDKELRYNVKAEKIERTVVDPETGKEKKVKETIDVADPNLSGYERYFDESCIGYEKDSDYNMMFLRAQQQYMNDLLRVRGHVFLNDVYDALGIQRTKAGQIVGWVYNKNNEDSDCFVDFRISTVTRKDKNGDIEEVIVIDPNVDGNILELI